MKIAISILSFLITIISIVLPFYSKYIIKGDVIIIILSVILFVISIVCNIQDKQKEKNAVYFKNLGEETTLCIPTDTGNNI